MAIDDPVRAERKLSQVGYYRLSGFWFTAREFRRDASGRPIRCPNTARPLRLDEFMRGTRFELVLALYLFDKRLRQIMLDAIERIEVYARGVIAHEVGYHDALAYQNPAFINPKQLADYVDRHGNRRNAWQEWSRRQYEQLARSREDCILWHRSNSRAMPFWVAVEAWDFGTTSKYFEMLKRDHQNRVASRFGLDNPSLLKVWLQQINTLRNRCAHHARIWNQVSSAPLPLPAADAYLAKIDLGESARARLYGLIAVIWRLVMHIGPGSTWVSSVADVVDSKPPLPGCTFEAMGLPTGSRGFPREAFT